MIQAVVKLDTIGYFCPMPIILTSKKIKELTTGQVLEVHGGLSEMTPPTASAPR